MANIYKVTGALSPKRSQFDNSYSVVGSTDMGLMIPVMCKSCTPGDIWNINQELVIRFMPMLQPILHEINAYTWSFFVPYRLLDEDWEDFVGGGWNGQYLPNGSDPISLPLWSGVRSTKFAASEGGNISLWDYLGFPSSDTNPIADEDLPIDYPLRAYNFIYNEYFRDENLEAEIEYPYDVAAVMSADTDPEKPGGSYAGMAYPTYNLFWGNWEKDYFTVSLPFQQRGASPALPLYGTADILNAITTFTGGLLNVSGTVPAANSGAALSITTNPIQNLTIPVNISSGAVNNSSTILKNWLNQNNVSGSIDLTTATAGDVNDLRQAFQLQKFLERNARIGVRYTEIMHGRYGQPLQDVRLQRPEYIGGSRTPIIVSEVLQTSESDPSPNINNQTGSMRGHGITADRTHIGKYKVREFGIIMTIMCIKPRSGYASQGIDREWNIRTPYDLIIPEFVNLSEQGVLNKEIYGQNNTANNNAIWGFIGRNDEYRTSNSKAVGLMRSPSFRPWHLMRYFTQPPVLNWQFIKINPNEQKRVFAVTNQQSIIYNFANTLQSIRPLPIIAEPGLIDHH